MIGFWTRIGLAFRSFFSIVSDGEVPQDILEELNPPETPALKEGVEVAPRQLEAPVESFDRAIQMLALLQRDGRLIDFLAEDVAPYPDSQLGAAVRSVHESCRQALERYVKLEPIIASQEDQPVTVEQGFDPAAIKLIGNVSGEPPLRGLLRHRGWKVKEVNLPTLPGSGRSVVAPAEVEVP